MSISRTARYIVTQLKMPEAQQRMDPQYSQFAKRILWLDNQVVEGAFHMNTSWYFRPNRAALDSHVHDTAEIIGFFGSDPSNPYDLGGEVEIWLEDEKHVINRTAMIFVPAGMVHCPLVITRVDRPIFHFTVVTGGRYVMDSAAAETTRKEAMTTLRTAKYVVTELKMPESKKQIDPLYSQYAKRILWMDDQVVEGAFHMNTSWFLKAAETLENKPHVHDTDEIIGFFGSDPSNPYDLGGEVEIWLEDEKHTINRTAMIFVPAGMVHCPLVITRVDRPIFHFTVVTGGKYEKEDKEKTA